MNEKTLKTTYGDVHYWVSHVDESKPWLVLLAGLTAEHNFYEKQIEYFKDKCNIVTWDAPGHGISKPFQPAYTMDEMAEYLHGIFEEEKVSKPILVGQSMGGYLAQIYMELYPGEAIGFISIDSAPMKKKYYSGLVLSFMHRTTGMYLSIPWNMLIKWTAGGISTTAEGQEYMRNLMLSYGKKEFCHLTGYGYRILVDAIRTNRAYEINCPVLLICGEKDVAGYVKKYNRQWTKDAGYKLAWVQGAAHNANMDAPREVNQLIEDFINEVV